MGLKLEVAENSQIAVEHEEGDLLVNAIGASGQGPRPTDYFLAGLGSCMLGTLMDFADNQGIDARGTRLAIASTTATRPIRLGSIEVTLQFPSTLTSVQVGQLTRAASRCKIHNTLTTAPEVNIAVGEIPPGRPTLESSLEGAQN